MGTATGAYTPEEIAIIEKMVMDYTPEQRALIQKPVSKSKPKPEKQPGPQVSRAIPILIKLYPPTGIPPVKLQAAFAAVNTVLTKRNETPPIERDSVRRAILVLKARRAP